MKDVQLDMQAKFDTQEKKWKEKVKELNRKHNGELSKVDAPFLLLETIPHSDSIFVQFLRFRLWLADVIK